MPHTLSPQVEEQLRGLTYMTTEEVASLCRTVPETVRYWRHTGKGPKSFKLGRRVLYERKAVENWLAEALGSAE
ncbi:MAG: helix-turn-helix domain-containing protein [Micropruina sp.]